MWANCARRYLVGSLVCGTLCKGFVIQSAVSGLLPFSGRNAAQSFRESGPGEGSGLQMIGSFISDVYNLLFRWEDDDSQTTTKGMAISL